MRFLVKIIFGLAIATFSLGACSTYQGAARSFHKSESQSSIIGDYLQARFAVSQQELEMAAHAYARAAKSQPHNLLMARYAFFYELASGDYGSAVTIAEKLTQPEYMTLKDEYFADPAIRPALALPELTLIANYIADGAFAKADTLLEEPSDNPFVLSISRMLKAWVAFETNGPEAGIAMLQDRPDGVYSGFSDLHLAYMYELSGDMDQAEQAYKRALSSYPSDMAVIQYASFIERKKQPQEALSIYQEMASNTGILRRAGRVGLARMRAPLAGETRTSLALIKKARPQVVKNAQEGAALVFYHFAEAAYEQAASEQAAAAVAGFTGVKVNLDLPLAFAQLAQMTDPHSRETDFLIGTIYDTYEMNEAAIKQFKKIPYANPYFEYATINLADILERIGNKKQAMQLLENYRSNDPLSPDIGMRLSQYYTDHQLYDKAEIELTHSIQLAAQLMDDELEGRSLWRYYFARGAARSEAGNWSGAEADLQKALSLSPRQPFVMNYLGYSWAERGENLEEAFSLIEEALKIRPNSGAITDSLGWAYYMLGEYNEAATYLERAVRLEPSDVTIVDHLGDVYWQLGRQLEARYEWQRALALDPTTEEKNLLLSKIKNGLTLNATPMAREH
ncbi:MAG: tetratricopeptide repeat protein [bacterium]